MTFFLPASSLEGDPAAMHALPGDSVPAASAKPIAPEASFDLVVAQALFASEAGAELKLSPPDESPETDESDDESPAAGPEDQAAAAVTASWNGLSLPPSLPPPAKSALIERPHTVETDGGALVELPSVDRIPVALVASHVPARLPEYPATQSLQHRPMHLHAPRDPEPPTMSSESVEDVPSEKNSIATGKDRPVAMNIPAEQRWETAGTPAAKHADVTKYSAKTGPAQQVANALLPVEPSNGQSAAYSEPIAAVPTLPRVGASQRNPDFSPDLTARNDPPPDSSSTPEIATVRSHPAERIELQLRERIVEFRSRGTDSMSVVLRPDGGTELHLQLRLNADRVEVHAHCARGDAAALQSDWTQLQESLSGMGVRLAALRESPLPSLTPNAPTDSSFGSNHRQPAAREDDARNPLPHFPEENSLPASKSAVRRGTSRLLESWA